MKGPEDDAGLAGKVAILSGGGAVSAGFDPSSLQGGIKHIF